MRKALLALLALALLPVAQAQLTITPVPPAGAISATGPTELLVDVAVECLFLLTSGGSADVTIAAPTAPAWLQVAGGDVSFDGPTCLTSQQTSVNQTATLTLTPSGEAPGLTPVSLALEASAAGAVGEPVAATAGVDGLHVAYVPGHTIAPTARTFEVTGGRHAFNLTIDVQANARTMVMFENKTVRPGGALDGLNAVTFDVAGGERSTTLPLTFRAPAGDWENVTVTFHNFSHCIPEGVQASCPGLLHQNVTWTFHNAGGSGGDGGDDGDSEDSPAGSLLALVAVAAAAVVAWRRR